MFRKKCQHQFEIVGYFYKEYLTEYKNCFDEVNAYKRIKCEKCEEISDVLLSSEKFEPQLHRGREQRKDAYIRKLKNMGFRQEVEITNKNSSENNSFGWKIMTKRDLIMFAQLNLELFNLIFKAKSKELSVIMKEYNVSKLDLHNTLWEEFNIPGMETRIANTAFDFLIDCCMEKRDLEDTLRKEIKKDILMSSIYYSNVAPNAINTH